MPGYGEIPYWSYKLNNPTNHIKGGNLQVLTSQSDESSSSHWSTWKGHKRGTSQPWGKLPQRAVFSRLALGDLNTDLQASRWFKWLRWFPKINPTFFKGVLQSESQNNPKSIISSQRLLHMARGNEKHPINKESKSTETNLKITQCWN